MNASSNFVAVSFARRSVASATAANSGAMLSKATYAVWPASVVKSRALTMLRNSLMVSGIETLTSCNASRMFRKLSFARSDSV
ncbi:hypothetical protein D3C71_2078410 [compost metagenome]